MPEPVDEIQETVTWSRAEYMESIQHVEQLLATTIDAMQVHLSTYGGDNETALAETRLREAGVWLLAGEANAGGTNIQDALRGI